MRDRSAEARHPEPQKGEQHFENRPAARRAGFSNFFAYGRAHALGGGGAVNCARSANPRACSICPICATASSYSVRAELLALDLLELVAPLVELVLGKSLFPGR